ncbi:hypothetical protein [Methanomethylophilus alvi]|uniref:hypothetical protein n=1 Tax=Methanomethylophilus alvi TaxID=1291540 RepID=UPI0037DC2ED2
MEQQRDVWLIRSGKQGEYELRFLQEEIIGLSITIGDQYSKPDDIKELCRSIKTIYSENERSLIASKVFTFTNRIRVGDYILMPSKKTGKICYVGVITSDYNYNPYSDISFTRSVQWRGSIEKSKFDQKTRNSMGSLLSIFHVNITEESLEMLTTYISEI